MDWVFGVEAVRFLNVVAGDGRVGDGKFVAEPKVVVAALVVHNRNGGDERFGLLGIGEVGMSPTVAERAEERCAVCVVVCVGVDDVSSLLV